MGKIKYYIAWVIWVLCCITPSFILWHLYDQQRQLNKEIEMIRAEIIHYVE